MADFGPWNPFPAMDDHKINQQTIEANDQVLAANKLKAIADQQDAQLDAEAARYMSTIAKGGSIPGDPNTTNAPASMSQAFMLTAQHLMELGAPTKAMEAMKAAQQIEKNEQDITDKQVTAQKNNADTLIKQSDLVGRYLGQAHSQAEWDDGLKTMEESGAFSPEQMNHFRSVPFHESTAAIMRDHSLSVNAQAQLDNQAADNARADAVSAATGSRAERALALAEHRSKEADRIRALAEKNGKAATAPSEQDVKQVSDVIVNQIYKGVVPGKNDPALKAGAAIIAARAKAMVTADKTLDWPTAVARAVAESEAEGDWQITPPETHMFGADDPGISKFDGVGKNKRSPMALPPRGVPPKIGKYYQTGRGVAKWDGKQFIPVE